MYLSQFVPLLPPYIASWRGKSGKSYEFGVTDSGYTLRDGPAVAILVEHRADGATVPLWVGRNVWDPAGGGWTFEPPVGHVHGGGRGRMQMHVRFEALWDSVQQAEIDDLIAALDPPLNATAATMEPRHALTAVSPSVRLPLELSPVATAVPAEPPEIPLMTIAEPLGGEPMVAEKPVAAEPVIAAAVVADDGTAPPAVRDAVAKVPEPPRGRSPFAWLALRIDRVLAGIRRVAGAPGGDGTSPVPDATSAAVADGSGEQIVTGAPAPLAMPQIGTASVVPPATGATEAAATEAAAEVATVASVVAAPMIEPSMIEASAEETPVFVAPTEPVAAVEVLAAAPEVPQSLRIVVSSEAPPAAVVPQGRMAAAADQPISIVFAGEMAYAAGIDILIDAIAVVVADSFDARYVFVGDGPLKDEIIARTHASGFGDRCRFHGHLSAEDCAAVLSNADIVVIPGRVAQSQSLARRALAAGCWLLTTHQACIDGVEHGRNGLVTYDNPGSLVWGLRDLQGRIAEQRRAGDASGRRAA